MSICLKYLLDFESRFPNKFSCFMFISLACFNVRLFFLIQTDTINMIKPSSKIVFIYLEFITIFTWYTAKHKPKLLSKE